MEASTAAEGSGNNNEVAFKTCGRTGRRGACVDTDIAREKLQDIIHKVEKVSLDDTTSSQSSTDEKGT